VAKAFPKGDAMTTARVVARSATTRPWPCAGWATGSNKIAAYPRIVDKLASLDLAKGRIVTLDAMGRQKEPAAKIIGLSGDYLLSLKANHPDRCKVQRYAAPAQKLGGVVERSGIAAVSLDEAALEGVARASAWPGPRRRSGPEGGPGPPRGTAMAADETRYFITSVSRPAERLF
jgi:hypothetical protein